MPHRLPGRVRLACGAVKLAVVAVLAVLALGSGPGAAVGQRSSAPVDVDQQLAAQPGPVARKLARHHCSPTGFDDGRQPVSAVVRSARGALRFVDFDTGWRVYTRHGAATLVAVCLDDPPVR
ncbi:hypothetical protein [Nocardioides sp. T2.26MG-1]|uniref:hypothetical protein n=1 Tax=Nocardioides sp. T2.26MG-1 TaxID=3041166 RepID=UPI002477A584|nr:hypothetical protein [Nocardioides sp. T2.26MG-1]CAI9401298.1 hypothetical protein HIDPHFAB_00581 [Nocardioides sp. T2.26MG-1]